MTIMSRNKVYQILVAAARSKSEEAGTVGEAQGAQDPSTQWEGPQVQRACLTFAPDWYALWFTQIWCVNSCFIFVCNEMGKPGWCCKTHFGAPKSPQNKFDNLE